MSKPIEPQDLDPEIYVFIIEALVSMLGGSADIPADLLDSGTGELALSINPQQGISIRIAERPAK